MFTIGTSCTNVSRDSIGSEIDPRAATDSYCINYRLQPCPSDTLSTNLVGFRTALSCLACALTWSLALTGPRRTSILGAVLFMIGNFLFGLGYRSACVCFSLSFYIAPSALPLRKLERAVDPAYWSLRQGYKLRRSSDTFPCSCFCSTGMDTYIAGFIFLALGGPLIFLPSFHLSNAYAVVLPFVVFTKLTDRQHLQLPRLLGSHPRCGHGRL